MKGNWVIAEVETAVDSQTHTGHPKILPVRADTEELRMRFRVAIGDLVYFKWRDVKDNDELLAAVLKPMAGRPETRPPPTESASGPQSSETAQEQLPIHLLSIKREPDKIEQRSPGEYLIETEPLAVESSPSSAGRHDDRRGGRGRGDPSDRSPRATGLGFFRVRILRDGALEVGIWSGASYRQVQSRPGEFIQMMQGDTHGWCFASHSLDESVLLGPPSVSDKPIASFDRTIVKAAWTIVHRRSTAEERFLILIKDPQA